MNTNSHSSNTGEKGERLYKQYKKRLYKTVYKFLPDAQDLEFTQAPVALDAVAELVASLKAVDRDQPTQVPPEKSSDD